MGDFTMMDYHELDMMVAQLEQEVKDLKVRLQFAEDDNSALRQQVRDLEAQVYSGKTM